MTSSLTLFVWATVAATSLLLCTQASVHSGLHMTSGHSKYEVDQQGRVYRGGQRDTQTADEGGRRGLYYDLAGGKGRDDDLQREGRFDERGHGDLEVKSWPVRGDENVLRQQYATEDLGAERFDTPHLLNYDDGVELLQKDLDSTLEEVDSQKNKRESHSLSIVNPLDVLRQRLMLDLATRKMKQNQEQIKANDLILKTLGKRSLLGHSSSGRTALTSKDYLSRHQDSTAEDFNL